MQTTLMKPVVGRETSSHKAETLPCGATVELSVRLSSNGHVNIYWRGHWFLVYREDLLDACSVQDVGRFGLGEGE